MNVGSGLAKANLLVKNRQLMNIVKFQTEKRKITYGTHFYENTISQKSFDDCFPSGFSMLGRFIENLD